MEILTKIKKQPHLDAFHCSYSAGKYLIEADNENAAKTAKYQLEIALASGYQADLLGSFTPRYTLRPLWLKSSVDIAITSQVGISLPAKFLQESHLEKLCQRTLELGYNSFLLGRFEGNATLFSNNSFDLNRILATCKKNGLQPIVKPLIPFASAKLNSRCPLDPAYTAFIKSSLKDLFHSLPTLDAIFWESQSLHPDFQAYSDAAEATQSELIHAEVKMVKSILGNDVKLIFYIPAQNYSTAQKQAKFIPKLCHDIDDNTIISFSTFAGSPWQDHLEMHPLFSSLKSTSQISETSLMPIVNVGSIAQGEGLWPSLPSQHADRVINHFSRHQFAGIVTLAPNIPSKGSMLECALWTASQMQWSQKSFEDIAETWFKAYKPEFKYKNFVDEFVQIRNIAIKISHMKSLYQEKDRDGVSIDECRSLADSLLAQLNYLEHIFQQQKTPKGHTQSDYFSIFARDARRFILHFMQTLHLPITTKHEDDLQDGFWTSAKADSFRNIKYTFHDTPNPGPPGSPMHKIFLATTDFA